MDLKIFLTNLIATPVIFLHINVAKKRQQMVSPLRYCISAGYRNFYGESHFITNLMTKLFNINFIKQSLPRNWYDTVDYRRNRLVGVGCDQGKKLHVQKNVNRCIASRRNTRCCS